MWDINYRVESVDQLAVVNTTSIPLMWNFPMSNATVQVYLSGFVKKYIYFWGGTCTLSCLVQNAIFGQICYFLHWLAYKWKNKILVLHRHGRELQIYFLAWPDAAAYS